jgi:anti-sigma factor RsiW
MNQNQETADNGNLIGEDLMAYLDGELGEDARRQLQERLAGDVELRQKLKEFQQTWDMLDELPREPVDDTFTRVTVEMVAQHAEGEVERHARRMGRRRKLAWIGGVSAALLAGIAGFVYTNWSLSEPNRRLVEDLPILQHLDAYRHAESIEFLRMLEREGLFKDEDGHAN